MSIWGDIGTVAAPTIVAVTALWFNNQQQKTSREHDRSERQKERDHDRAMHDRAERHERRLSDLDYQRQLVDDMAAAWRRAAAAVSDLWALWWLYPQEKREEKQRQSTEVNAARSALLVERSRMILRFGHDHPAIELIGRASEAMFECWMAHGKSFDADETLKVITDESESLHEALQEFLTLTGGIVGSAPERD